MMRSLYPWRAVGHPRVASLAALRQFTSSPAPTKTSFSDCLRNTDFTHCKHCKQRIRAYRHNRKSAPGGVWGGGLNCGSNSLNASPGGFFASFLAETRKEGPAGTGTIVDGDCHGLQSKPRNDLCLENGEKRWKNLAYFLKNLKKILAKALDIYYNNSARVKMPVVI